MTVITKRRNRSNKRVNSFRVSLIRMLPNRYLAFVTVSLAALYNLSYYYGMLDENKFMNELLISNYQDRHAPPPSCTNNEITEIRKQLSDTCPKKLAWRHECSITNATRCIGATWLTEHYTNLHKDAHGTGYAESFLGISIGCNKGLDAVETMRMGTSNMKFDKSMWWDVMHEGSTNITEPYCENEKNMTHQFHITSDVNAIKRKGEMHCIEAFPLNYNRLKYSAEKLGLEEEGFVVTNSVISLEDGKTAFPTSDNETEVGVESLSMYSCHRKRHKLARKKCKEVDGFTLDSYVEKKVTSQGPINILTIDVEGADFDVLLGSKDNALDRVEYLEFEYNWMGAWSKKNLSDAIELLEDRKFTCYWAGDDRLWRISGCWEEKYNIKMWANVACVHHSQQSLGDIMENFFQRTLKDGKVFYPNTVHSRYAHTPKIL